MGDLVERLQRLGKDSVGNYGMPIAAEAANEIESLQSDLAKSASREAALRALLKEARKIVRASSQRALVRDWDRRATDALAKIKETTC